MSNVALLAGSVVMLMLLALAGRDILRSLRSEGEEGDCTGLRAADGAGVRARLRNANFWVAASVAVIGAFALVSQGLGMPPAP